MLIFGLILIKKVCVLVPLEPCTIYCPYEHLEELGFVLWPSFCWERDKVRNFIH